RSASFRLREEKSIMSGQGVVGNEFPTLGRTLGGVDRSRKFAECVCDGTTLSRGWASLIRRSVHGLLAADLMNEHARNDCMFSQPLTEVPHRLDICVSEQRL